MADSCQVLIFNEEWKIKRNQAVVPAPHFQKIEPMKTVIKKKLNAKNVRDWAKVAKKKETEMEK